MRAWLAVAMLLAPAVASAQVIEDKSQMWFRMYVNVGRGWIEQTQFATLAECDSIAKAFVASMQPTIPAIQAGCAKMPRVVDLTPPSDPNAEPLGKTTAECQMKFNVLSNNQKAAWQQSGITREQFVNSPDLKGGPAGSMMGLFVRVFPECRAN